MHLTMDQIIARVSLPEYVGRFTAVTQKGNEYVCYCPFHDDSKPSMQMYIKGNKWRYRCQPCGAKGDLVDFVMNYDDVDYVGAKKILMGENDELRTAPVKKIIVKPDPCADFEPLPLGDNQLKGREIIVFPDNDQPGHDVMHKISHVIGIKVFAITRDEAKGFDIVYRNFTR